MIWKDFERGDKKVKKERAVFAHQEVMTRSWWGTGRRGCGQGVGRRRDGHELSWQVKTRRWVGGQLCNRQFPVIAEAKTDSNKGEHRQN